MHNMNITHFHDFSKTLGIPPPPPKNFSRPGIFHDFSRFSMTVRTWKMFRCWWLAPSPQRKEGPGFGSFCVEFACSPMVPSWVLRLPAVNWTLDCPQARVDWLPVCGCAPRHTSDPSMANPAGIGYAVRIMERKKTQVIFVPVALTGHSH